MPRLMIRTLALHVTHLLNLFPAKHGISKFYSPYQIMMQRPLDYDKEFQFSFGAYVQAHTQQNPTNSNEPRTLDAIYLRPATDGNGHELMDLSTGRLITRSHLTVVPLSELVKDRVHELAHDQGITEIVFKNKAIIRLLNLL